MINNAESCFGWPAVVQVTCAKCDLIFLLANNFVWIDKQLWILITEINFIFVIRYISICNFKNVDYLIDAINNYKLKFSIHITIPYVYGIYIYVYFLFVMIRRITWTTVTRISRNDCIMMHGSYLNVCRVCFLRLFNFLLLFSAERV